MSSPQTKTAESPIQLTEGALSEMQRLMNEKNVPDDHGLRIGVRGGGCAGFSYILGFDTQKEGDEVFDYKGLTLLMNKAHGLYLAGVEIDYKEGLDSRGFIFNNPNAESTCGCGSSFG